jgi:hypothetical protein
VYPDDDGEVGSGIGSVDIETVLSLVARVFSVGNSFWLARFISPDERRNGKHDANAAEYRFRANHTLVPRV